MSTPKARPKRKQAKKKVPDYTVGPIPDDAFGAAADPPPPPGPEAPPISIDARFEYLLNNPDLYTAAASLPDASRVGRPAHYPSVVYLIFLCSISIFGSARSTACSLQRPLWWDQVLNAVRSHSGDEAAAALLLPPDRAVASGTITSKSVSSLHSPRSAIPAAICGSSRPCPAE